MTDLDKLKALAEAAKFSELLQVDYQCLRVGLDDENLLAFLMHGDSEDGEYVCVDEEPTERDGPPSPRLEFIAALVNAFPDLIERLEKAESRIRELEAALKPFAVWSKIMIEDELPHQERISGEAYEEDEPVLVSDADGRPEGVVFLRDLRTASRALGGDHE